MSVDHRLTVGDLVHSMRDVLRILGRSDRSVSRPSPIDQADSESLTFCTRHGETGARMVRDSRAGVIVCHDDLPLSPGDASDKTIILVPNPRLAFSRLVGKHFVKPVEPGVSPHAAVDQSATIHSSAYVGPNSSLGCCEIGENTVIYGNVIIYSGTVIGNNVIIHAGAVIGAEGMGFERNAEGELEKFPQIGGVLIEDDVEIGANAAIMRGAMGNTVIGRGTKVGHLCTVGHGVFIGRHCLITTHAKIGGSARIGDYSQVWMGASVRNGVTIGRRAVVGMGSAVTRDVGDGTTVVGVPAREVRAKAG